MRRIEHEEEIDPERIPVDLAHAADRRAQILIAKAQGEGVAELELEHFHPVAAHRQLRGRRRILEPGAFDERVGFGQGGAPGNAHLSLDPATGFFVARTQVQGRILAIDGDQLAGGQRQQAEIVGAERAQPILESRALVGLQVEDEIIGRVRRQFRTPALEQGGAHHGQQIKCCQAQGQCSDLDHCQALASAEIGQPEAQRARPVATDGTQEAQDQQGEQAGQQAHRKQSARQHEGQGQRIALRHQQAGADRERQQVEHIKPAQTGLHVLAEHAHWLDVTQPQQRRQGKPDQHGQADGNGREHGCEWNRRRSGAQHRSGKGECRLMQGQANGSTRGESRQCQHAEFQQQRKQDLVAAGAKATQQGHLFRLATCKALRRKRHRNAGQQYRKQRRHAQEVFPALESRPQVGLGVGNRRQARVVRQARLCPVRKALNGIGVTGKHEPIACTAADAEQATGFGVPQVHHHGRGKLHHRAAGCANQFAGNSIVASAQLHDITNAALQRCAHRVINVDLAVGGCSHALLQSLCIGHHQFPAQGKIPVDGTDFSELAAAIGKQHAGELDAAAAGQSKAGGLCGEFFGQCAARSADAEVAAHQVRGRTKQGMFDATGQGAYGSECGHGQQQGNGQGRQFTVAELAAQAAPCKCSGFHASPMTMRPSLRRTLRWQRAARLWSWLTMTRVVACSRLRENNRSLMAAPVR